LVNAFGVFIDASGRVRQCLGVFVNTSAYSSMRRSVFVNTSRVFVNASRRIHQHLRCCLATIH
jgi:hypothetical protein